VDLNPFIRQDGRVSMIRVILGIAAINMPPGAAAATVAGGGTSPVKIGVKQVLKNNQFLDIVNFTIDADSMIERMHQALRGDTNVGFGPEVITKFWRHSLCIYNAANPVLGALFEVRPK